MPDELAQQACYLRAQGATLKKIAAVLGLSVPQAWRLTRTVQTPLLPDAAERTKERAELDRRIREGLKAGMTYRAVAAEFRVSTARITQAKYSGTGRLEP